MLAMTLKSQRNRKHVEVKLIFLFIVAIKLENKQ